MLLVYIYLCVDIWQSISLHFERHIVYLMSISLCNPNVGLTGGSSCVDEKALKVKEVMSLSNKRFIYGLHVYEEGNSYVLMFWSRFSQTCYSYWYLRYERVRFEMLGNNWKSISTISALNNFFLFYILSPLFSICVLKII